MESSIDRKKRRLREIEEEVQRVKSDFNNALEIQSRIAAISPNADQEQISLTVQIGRAVFQQLVTRIERDIEIAKEEITRLENLSNEIKESNKERLSDN